MQKKFVRFLGELKKPKSPFEINSPLLRLIWSALSIVRVNDSTDPIEICNASLEIDLFIWPPWHIIPFLGPEGKRQEYDNAAPIARADFLALEGWASLARLIHSILYWSLGGSYLSTLVYTLNSNLLYRAKSPTISIHHPIFNHFSLEYTRPLDTFIHPCASGLDFSEFWLKLSKKNTVKAHKHHHFLRLCSACKAL